LALDRFVRGKKAYVTGFGFRSPWKGP